MLASRQGCAPVYGAPCTLSRTSYRSPAGSGCIVRKSGLRRYEQAPAWRAPTCGAFQEESSRESISKRLKDNMDLPFGPISALAGLGLAELTGGSVFCPASTGCSSILSSSFAELFGLPLSLFGAVAYAGVLILSAWATKSSDESKWAARLGVLTGSTALTTSSAYLMWLLFSEFDGELCTWCIGSAMISSAIAALAIPAGFKRSAAEAGGSVGVGMAATVAALALGGPSNAAITELPYYLPEVDTQSPPGAVELARDLRQSGAKMYGAFWCPHCHEQKEVFGSAAMKEFPYVECFPGGWERGKEQAEQCTAADIRGYPTWVINGKKVEGGRDLQTLRQLLEDK